MWNLLGSIGICRWWTTCGAELLRSILLAAKLSLPAAGSDFRTGVPTATLSCRELTLAAWSEENLRGRFASPRAKLSPIVGLSAKATSLFSTASLRRCRSARVPRQQRYATPSGARESRPRMRPARANLLRWDSAQKTRLQRPLLVKPENNHLLVKPGNNTKRLSM